MNSQIFQRKAGWIAILSGVFTILMLLSAVLGSTLKLGNTFTFVLILLMALMMLLAIELHRLVGSQSPSISLAGTVIGILGMLLSIIVHILMLVDLLTQAQFNTTGEGLGPAGVGIWLLLTNYLALRGKVFRRGLAMLGMIAGVGYLMSGVGALLGGVQTLVEGPQNSLSQIGPLGIFFLYPIWAIWLGRRLTKQPTQQFQTARRTG